MHTISIPIGQETLTLETGRMARLANGAVFAQYAGTSILATACCSSSYNEDLDFVPLSVEYNEKYYAAGKIPGGFLKREARPKDKEIIVSRLIDRPIRPLLDKQFQRELQIVPTVLSTDRINPSDVIAIIAASAALTISDIPFSGPIAAVRVSYVADTFIINPTFEQIKTSTLDIIVAGSIHGITMVEGGAKETSEEIMLEAIEQARPHIKHICEKLLEFQTAVGSDKLPLAPARETLPNVDAFYAELYPQIKTVLFEGTKQERATKLAELHTAMIEKYSESLEGFHKQFSYLFENIEQEILRQSIIEHNIRIDTRNNEEIRPITCEVNVLQRTHGSALFTRGETQALVVNTLGTEQDEQMLDDIDGENRERFMLHYNFPPFSVGETGRLATGRREIGHGHLAWRALEPVLPKKDQFPYTIRLVSEILESNGSSSMATVCGGSLALLHAGVPLKESVAGIAMGLIQENDSYVVLSDILGNEDHLGDMDFKVAGTKNGITAFQMDIKIENVSFEILKVALEQAKKGRMHILSIMNNTLDKPNTDISPYAPRVINFSVPVSKIGTLIGQGGKTIRSINEQFNVNTNIDESGSVSIYSSNQDAAICAKEAFLSLIEEAKIGNVYEGTVKNIKEFGIFVEILPGKEGLCHISKLPISRGTKIDTFTTVGAKLSVKVINIDEKNGKIGLTCLEN